MKKRPPTNLSASVHQKLLNRAKDTNRPFSELLQYFAMERFLYRLSRSPHAGKFTLKGGFLIATWRLSSARPTLDIDLLGQTENSIDNLSLITSDICAQQVEDDGLIFDTDSIAAERIIAHGEYQGIRLTFTGMLGSSRIHMQLDVGFNDVVIPLPLPVEIPTILEFPAPSLACYSEESVVAEKLEAIIKLGLLTSRMKDFFDIWVLSSSRAFSGPELCEAITKTLSRRSTSAADLATLLDKMSSDAVKQVQWTAFVRRGRLSCPSFPEIIADLRRFLVPVTEAVSRESHLEARWDTAKGWLVNGT